MKNVFYVLKLDKKFAVVLLFVSLMVGGMMPLSKAHANLLTNPSFVGTFQNATSPATGYIAPGYWGDNSIGTVGVNYGAENAIKHDVFGYSQRIEVNSIGQGGAVQFYQNVPFTQGHYYQASVWLRSSITMTVNICFRLNGPPYTYFTDESTDNFHVTPVTVQPYWQQFWVSCHYGSNAPGRFQISPQSPGILYVDQADLEDTTGVEAYNRQIEFSGIMWNVRDSGDNPQAPAGGHKNFWNNSSNNVSVDGSGYLHLKMTSIPDPIDGQPNHRRWYCPELKTVDSLGLGTYQFWVNGAIDALGANDKMLSGYPGVVFAVFSYPTDYSLDGHDEIDMEFSHWGTHSTNADYNVWPKEGSDPPKT